jgi:hypothetical protein
MIEIEQMLADAAEQADTMRRFGASAQADAITGLIAQLRGAPSFRAFLTWHNESEAETLSGHAQDWFRQRYAYFEKLGLARRQGRVRQYRETLVRGVCTGAAIEAAKQDAENAVRKEAA